MAEPVFSINTFLIFVAKDIPLLIPLLLGV